MQAGFLQWLGKVFSGNRTPTRLDLGPPKIVKPPSAPSVATAPAATPIPGNFMFFGMFLELTVEGVVHVGLPQRAVRLMRLGGEPPEIRWGVPPEWGSDDPSKPHAPWIDDPKNGVAQRNILSVVDLLGAEGTVGGRHYRFETILELKKSGPREYPTYKVTYGLYDDESRSRMAYGFYKFDGALFEGLDLIDHLI